MMETLLSLFEKESSSLTSIFHIVVYAAISSYLACCGHRVQIVPVFLTVAFLYVITIIRSPSIFFSYDVNQTVIRSEASEEFLLPGSALVSV